MRQDGGGATRWTRRDFLVVSLAGAATMLGGGCAAARQETGVPGDGRLRARPAAAPSGTSPTGLQPLRRSGRRDTLLYVPAGYRAERPAPLLVMLHGAGGEARYGIDLLRPVADRAGVILVAPASRAATWDLLRGGFGPDVEEIDRTLAQVFAGYAVDPARLAAGGFSDGASYALSLGMTNGDLFSHLVAFSPGFAVAATLAGRPRIYVSHGTRDTVLTVDKSRRLVPELREAGYEVRYHEFDGPHTVPPEITAEAVGWLAGGGA